MKNLLKGVALAFGILLVSNAVNAQQKVGHINTGVLIESTQDYKSAAATLEKLRGQKDSLLNNLYVEYQKKQTEANDKMRNRSEANKDAIDAEVQKIATDLRSMEERIQQSQQAAQEELGKKQQELFTPIQTKLRNAINAVAKEKGYAYVLDVATGSVAYFDGGDDLNADVLTKLGVSPSVATPAGPAKK
ncbi:OmpH family outer membrane protein [Sphingobacterium sp. HJSM2_6]|uniref:OmpH family outer membrane protein n=1 Tax=Sphingobacterium sp. HJSM2_6 TaxID=3366264 RepID=UPI003BC81641